MSAAPNLHPSSTGTPILKVRDLSVSFLRGAPGIRAVDSLCFEVPAGGSLALVGESGSGKTASCRAITGVLPPSATVSGDIWVNGKHIAAGRRSDFEGIRGRVIAMVLQDTARCLDPTRRVGQQIADAVGLHLGLHGRAARQEAESLMDLLRFDSAKARYGSYPHELSGGMKQRIAIAIAIAGRPRLLVADESMRALDPMSKSATVKLLKDIQRERGMALLLVSHNLHSLHGLVDEVLVMFAGRVVERAPTSSLLARPRMPYTRALLLATPGPTTTRQVFLSGSKGDFDSTTVASGCPYAARCESSIDECRSRRPPLKEVLGPHAAACWRLGDEALP